MEVHIHIIAPPGELGLVIHVDDDPMKGSGYIPKLKRQSDNLTERTGGESGRGGGGGATITGIDPKCTLFGQVEVGDRIITIDDHIITSNADFHINTNQTRKLGISKHTTLLAKIRKEEEHLGETLKYTLSGLEIAKMQTQIQQLGKLHDEALGKVSVLNEKLERASAKETALEAQLREAKTKMKELNQENVSLKATLVREKRSWEKQQRDEEKKRKEEDWQKMKATLLTFSHYSTRILVAREKVPKQKKAAENEALTRAAAAKPAQPKTEQPGKPSEDGDDE